MKINRTVFFTSAGIILLFVSFGALFTETAGAWTSATQNFIATQLGWFYSLCMTFFLGFVVWILFSKYGHIRLGQPDETPKYNYLTWFSMLFSAGIGIGLLFFGVAEPLYHFTHPPHATGEVAGSVAAAEKAIAVTFFHWGLHGWSLYVIVGLSLAYFGYRRDLPLTFRSTLYPILGEKIYGLPGDVIEILAVFGTLFGVATSLGLGVIHVNTGLSMFGWLEYSTTNQILLIAGITVVATISVVSGLDRGIRRLSEINFSLGVVLLAFVFFLGPGLFLIRAYIQDLGYYIQHLPELSLMTGAYAADADGLTANINWQKAWTVFYWGWWISWSPFVGMFIARISRGRTIREFVLGVLLVPCTFITFWMSTFGNTAIYMQKYDTGVGQGVDLMARITSADGTFQFFKAFYVTLEALPWASLTMTVATVSGIIYFVTSSDSASLIIDILTSDNDPAPPVGQRIFWAVTEGAVAAVLMATGGKDALQALQTASITAALPFSLVILAICYCLVKGLRAEPLER